MAIGNRRIKLRWFGGCDRRNVIHHRAIIAIIFYVLILGVTIAYAATEINQPEGNGWSVGNILLLISIGTGAFFTPIIYIFTSTIKGLREDRREDRNDHEIRNEALDATLLLIFSELKLKQDKAQCQHDMDKHETAINDVRSI